MQYRNDKSGTPISLLGYGCMRFTRKGSGIDYAKAESEVLYAIKHGVNYFDTAFVYPGSEELMGKIFANNHIREQVYIATKLPQYLMHSIDAVEKTFQKELDRLQTDYIDYYLMHMFTDIQNWKGLQALGIEKWIEEKKSSGAIRNIGFSYHGNSEMFIKILDAYDWDFCQIQYNYLDQETQAGRTGMLAAAAKGIPVIIMEPLRGGKLVNQLPKDAVDLIHGKHPDWTPAELGLRWLWNQPEVTCVLSGMNSIDMVNENIRIASEVQAGEFDAKDDALIEEVVAKIRAKEKVGCTGCRYCMPCPMGVDIPGNFNYYNQMFIDKKHTGRFEFAQVMGMRKKPGFASLCVGCGKCEKHCPQNIPIRQKLKEADKALRPLPYKIGIAIANKIIVKK